MVRNTATDSDPNSLPSTKNSFDSMPNRIRSASNRAPPKFRAGTPETLAAESHRYVRFTHLIKNHLRHLDAAPDLRRRAQRCIDQFEMIDIKYDDRQLADALPTMIVDQRASA